MRILAIEDNEAKAAALGALIFEVDHRAIFKICGDIRSAFVELDATMYDLVGVGLDDAADKRWKTSGYGHGASQDHFSVTAKSSSKDCCTNRIRRAVRAASERIRAIGRTINPLRFGVERVERNPSELSKACIRTT